MTIKTDNGGVNARPRKVVPIRGGSAALKEPVPLDKLPLALDASAELRFAHDLAEGEQHAVGGMMDSGEVDPTLFLWTGEFWQAQSTQKMASFALNWLRHRQPDKATANKARECVDTAVLELLHRGTCSLADSRQRAILPVREAYLEIEDTGVVRVLPVSKDLGITYQVPASFDASRVAMDGTYTPAPVDPNSKWGRYLDRFMPDLGVREVLQEAVASSLLPLCLEKAFFLVGDGSNGKSTFLHVLRALHPQNAVLRMDMLDRPFAMKPLVGKTAAIATEMPKVLSSKSQEILKALASRDPVQVEGKGKDAYTALPRCTLFIALNEWFSVSGHEHGFWRKVLAIPFSVRLAEGDVNRVPDFHKLITEDPAEMAQVLDWILEGAIRLIRRGKRFSDQLPEAITDMAAKNRLSSDTVAAYLEDRQVAVCEHVQTSKTAVYNDYRNFVLDEAGKRPVAAEEFWRRVRALQPEVRFQHLTEGGRKVRTTSLAVVNVKSVRDSRILYTNRPSDAQEEGPVDERQVRAMIEGISHG